MILIWCFLKLLPIQTYWKEQVQIHNQTEQKKILYEIKERRDQKKKPSQNSSNIQYTSVRLQSPWQHTDPPTPRDLCSNKRSIREMQWQLINTKSGNWEIRRGFPALPQERFPNLSPPSNHAPLSVKKRGQPLLPTVEPAKSRSLQFLHRYITTYARALSPKMHVCTSLHDQTQIHFCLTLKNHSSPHNSQQSPQLTGLFPRLHQNTQSTGQTICSWCPQSACWKVTSAVPLRWRWWGHPVLSRHQWTRQSAQLHKLPFPT